MKTILGSQPPQWDHHGWTVTLDPTSASRSPRYGLCDRDGADAGCCDSLSAAGEVIDAERAR